MSKIFVSHASADAAYAEKFVDNLLRIGCGLDGASIFYSSERDTGVPSGEDLMNSVRTEVQDSTLVIALITPMYQTRPVCIAELGAAWGRSGKFFPLMAPSMSRDELEGIIPHTLVQRADDSATLDELADRIVESLQIDVPRQRWGAAKKKWFAFLSTPAAELSRPVTVSLDVLDQLKAELEETREALRLTTEELSDSEARIDQLKALKDPTDVAAVLLPSGETERFHVLAAAARQSVSAQPQIVREAFYQAGRGTGVAMPRYFEDPDGLSEFEDAVERKLLVEDDDTIFVPNLDKTKISNVTEHLDALGKFFNSDERTSEFLEWFEQQYEATPDLCDRDCWEALIE